MLQNGVVAQQSETKLRVHNAANPRQSLSNVPICQGGCGRRCPWRTHSRSSLHLHSPAGVGASSQRQEGLRARAGCLLAREEERKENPLMGTEPLLFKMSHTQLDKYCKNLQTFLFINPHVCTVSLPWTHMWQFPVFQHLSPPQGTDYSKGPPKSPPQTELQSPLGKEGP